MFQISSTENKNVMEKHQRKSNTTMTHLIINNYVYILHILTFLYCRMRSASRYPNFKYGREYWKTTVIKNNLQVADTLSDLLQVPYVCTTLSHHILSTMTNDHSQKVCNIQKKMGSTTLSQSCKWMEGSIPNC
jgi:hypothetical protein